MSDIQDMIHTQTMNSYEKGQQVERERIIELLEAARSVFIEDTVSYRTMTGLIALIKGEK